MKTILLIDGHSLLFQMYYGMPNKIKNKDGDYIEGIIGFLGALRKIKDITNPDYIHLVFDGECENPNKALNADYKANRVDYSTMGAENNPFFQLPHIYDCLDELNISFEETTNCECDDLIAGIVRRYQTDYKIIICSKDSDFFQLINENVEVFRYAGLNSIFWNEEYFKEKYPFKPSSLVTYKALVGDSSDNVKGLLGVGQKTATKIINEYGDLPDILMNIKDIVPEKIRTLIDNNQELLKINYQIVDLLSVEPYEIDLENKAYFKKEYKTNEILKKLNIGF